MRSKETTELWTIAAQTKQLSKCSKGRNVKEKGTYIPIPVCVSNAF